MRNPQPSSGTTNGTTGLRQTLQPFVNIAVVVTAPGAGVGWAIARLPGRERWRTRFLLASVVPSLLVAVLLSGWVAGQTLLLEAATRELLAVWPKFFLAEKPQFDPATILGPLLLLSAYSLLTSPLWAAYWLWRPLTARELKNRLKSPRSGPKDNSGRRESGLDAVRLGYFLDGDLRAWRRGGQLWLPTDTITRHIAVVGTTGSGKTEGIMRLVSELARAGFCIFYIDGKGDADLAERFKRVMLAAGVDQSQVKAWPDEPFDFWRATNSDRYNKLYALSASDVPYYDNVGKSVLGKTLRREPGAPEVSNSRQFRAALAAAVDSKDRDQKSVLVKFDGILQDIGNLFDGSWAFEDTRAAYIGINSLQLGEISRHISAAFLLEAARFASTRHGADRPALIVLDEFSAAGSDKALALVERARFKKVGLCLSTQTVAGMGDAATASRLLGNCNVLAVFRTPNPEPLLTLLGTQKSFEIGEQLQGSSTTGLATRRLQHQFKVAPDVIRSLEDGEAILIHRGHYARVFIDRVNDADAKEPVPLEGTGVSGVG